MNPDASFDTSWILGQPRGVAPTLALLGHQYNGVYLYASRPNHLLPLAVPGAPQHSLRRARGGLGSGHRMDCHPPAPIASVVCLDDS